MERRNFLTRGFSCKTMQPENVYPPLSNKRFKLVDNILFAATTIGNETIDNHDHKLTFAFILELHQGSLLRTKIQTSLENGD